MDLIRHPIVFLHLPKTAGQTVHNALAAAVGPARVSPVRVHTQAGPGAAQFPPGHALYSGHLDWDGIGALPDQRFTFTILRDPRERIASFYLYLRREAQRLPPEVLAQPENVGRHNALTWSADDYFFGGDDAWQAFVRDHFDNFYCSYFGTRRVRGGAAFRALPRTQAIAHARHGLASLDGVFRTDDLRALEAVMAERYGFALRLSGRYDNAGDRRGEPRWPRLLAAFETDAARNRIDDFVDRDCDLLSRRTVSA
jgi:hypothetical protein